METITIEKDIKVFYVTATSFPDGIMKAFEDIYKLVPFSTDRKFFGISRPENGVIVYKAGVEESYEGEAEKFNCPTLVLKKGKYISTAIKDFMQDLPAIGKSFKEMLANPAIDPEGYCVEWYFNDKDVQCMVRLEE